MDATISIGTLLSILGGISAMVAGIGAIITVVKYLTSSHDRVQKWDEYDNEIKQIQKEQCMLTYCMMATLDGLQQLGCNGEVKKARTKIDEHLNKQAHGVN